MEIVAIRTLVKPFDPNARPYYMYSYTHPTNNAVVDYGRSYKEMERAILKAFPQASVVKSW